MSIGQIFNDIKVFQFGCGGTGGWLVRPLSKFLNNLMLRNHGLLIRYLLIDGDIVSERNIIRQNFEDEDIGSYKAISMKRNFPCDLIAVHTSCLSTPKKIKDYIEDGIFYSDNYSRKLNLILGCTDSIKFRRSVYTYLKKTNIPTVYIDSGNNLHNGQIITTIFNITEDHFRNAGRFKNINIHKFFPKDSQEENAIGCEFFGDQSQSINMLAANLMFINIQRMLVECMLPTNKIEFNSSGYSTFQLI